MPLLSYTDAPAQLLDLFHTEKESILARYYEPEPGLFIAESAKVTLRAADAGYRIIAMLADESQINRETKDLLARFPDIPVYHAPSAEFLEISGYPMTRGVLALFRRKLRSRPDPLPRSMRKDSLRDSSLCSGYSGQPFPRSAEGGAFPFMEEGAFPALGQVASNPANRRFAVLEEVGNPANIGAIFRSAAALNIDAILLSKGCCDPLSRRCLRVSMGTVFLVPWAMTGLPGALIAESLRSYGIQTAALALSDDSVPVTEDALKQSPRLALFLGNEGNGLRKETIGACDHVVRIPMREGVDSLNVAAASAVAFWELRI